MVLRKVFRHFLHANFFMFILLTVIIRFFSFNLELICTCEFSKNWHWTRNRMITSTYMLRASKKKLLNECWLAEKKPFWTTKNGNNRTGYYTYVPRASRPVTPPYAPSDTPQPSILPTQYTKLIHGNKWTCLVP